MIKVRFFWQLLDAIKSYTGKGGKFIRIKEDESGLEAVDITGGGDMLKSVYDTNNNNIVDKAETIDGILNSDIQNAIALKHDGTIQDNIIATKTTLTEVKNDADISDAIAKRHSPYQLGTKQIDEIDIGDGKVIAYNQAENKLKYVVSGVGGNGDMTKAVYDTNDNGIVDKAERIEGILNEDIQSAIVLKHDGALQDSIIATKTTLQEVKSDTDISDAINKKHSHPNKELLDTYTQTNEDITDAVAKKHSPHTLGTKEIDETGIGNGKVIKYNSLQDKLVYEFVGDGGGVGTFIELTDTPDDYTGQSGKFVRVKEDETGLEFSAYGVGVYEHHHTIEDGSGQILSNQDIEVVVRDKGFVFRDDLEQRQKILVSDRVLKLQNLDIPETESFRMINSVVQYELSYGGQGHVIYVNRNTGKIYTNGRKEIAPYHSCVYERNFDLSNPSTFLLGGEIMYKNASSVNETANKMVALSNFVDLYTKNIDNLPFSGTYIRDEKRKRFYALAGGNFYIIDATNGNIIGEYVNDFLPPVFVVPEYFDEENGLFYTLGLVGLGDFHIFKIDIINRTVIQHSYAGWDIVNAYIEYNPANNKIYISKHLINNIGVYDGSDVSQPIKVIFLGENYITGMGVNPATNMAYVMCSNMKMFAIDMETDEVRIDLQLPYPPDNSKMGVRVDTSRNFIYVTLPAENRICRLQHIFDRTPIERFLPVVMTHQTSQTPQPNKIPVADENGKLNAWVDGGVGGGGDMLKSTYDTNDDGIVDNADVILNNVQYKWGMEENGRVYLEVR